VIGLQSSPVTTSRISRLYELYCNMQTTVIVPQTYKMDDLPNTIESSHCYSLGNRGCVDVCSDELHGVVDQNAHLCHDCHCYPLPIGRDHKVSTETFQVIQ
jgi:hypothetical protein